MDGRRAGRARLSCLLLAALGILSLAAGAAVYRFALPRPTLVEAGPVADFPPSSDPYSLGQEPGLYIVNDGEEIFALDRTNRASVLAGCRVDWNSIDRVFIDPCRGDHFDLYGRPVRIAVKALTRYPVKIEGRYLFVEMSGR